MVVIVRGRWLLLALVGLVVAVSTLVHFTAEPVWTATSRLLVARLVPIYKVERPEPWIAFSFDATWGTENTDRLLEILARYGVKTTFFLAGNWVEEYPEYVRKIADAGHEIGNHSYAHGHMASMSEYQIRQDLERNGRMIERLTGTKPVLFRPPFGEYNDLLIRVAQEMGLYPVQWSIDSLDWKDLPADAMVERVLKDLGPGEIVLFHNAGKHTPEAVERLIPEIQRRGYRIVPVGELIYRRNYTVDSHSGVQRPLPEPPGRSQPAPGGEDAP
ncbi:MAG TPA: polysaccharide deacetylase family protein [Limnochorda sp.]